MRVIILAVAALLSACTTYEASMFGGATSRQVAERVWEVDVAGNAFASLSSIEDYVMLKIAEVGRENSFDCFIIMDRNAGYDTFRITMGIAGWNATTSCFGSTCNTTGTFNHPTTSEHQKPRGSSRVYFLTAAEASELGPIERGLLGSVSAVWNDLGPRHISDFAPMPVPSACPKGAC